MVMFKVKNNINLKELQKLGYIYDEEEQTYTKTIRDGDHKCYVTVYRNRYISSFIKVEEDLNSGDEYYIDDSLLKLFYDLIKNDLVEYIKE